MPRDPVPVLTIVGRPLVKKNGRPIFFDASTGSRRIGKRASLAAMEEEAYYQLREQWGNRPRITYRVSIAFLFWLPTQQDADLSNLIELPQDALQAAGILQNDLLVASLDGTRKFLGCGKKNARTEIHIREYV